MTRWHNGLLGLWIFAGALFCFFMATKSMLFLVAIVYFCPANYIYMKSAEKYLTRHGLIDAKSADDFHQKRLNRMFIDALKWPILIWRSK